MLRFDVSRSVITVQREFRARFRKDEPCMVHCNHRSGHQKTKHTKTFPAATASCKLTPRPRCKHEKRTALSGRETWTVAAANGVRFARVR